MFHAFGRHHGDVDVAIFIVVHYMEVQFDGFVGAVADAEEHRVGDFDVVIYIVGDGVDEAVFHALLVGRLEGKGVVEDKGVALEDG